MANKEVIAKVSEELKAQGINATPEQIESAISKVASKQELGADALDNVAGGFDPSSIIPMIPTVIDTVKKILPGGGGDNKSDDKGGNDAGGGAGGSTETNTINQTGNTNNQGIQGNQPGGSGTQKNVQSVNSGGGNVSF
ncbi:MAG: hypothetical protein IJ563_12480 [Selenomonadaceae bacterium]|nr:hypothetical protein [Selenomonadaceae bacterium]